MSVPQLITALVQDDSVYADADTPAPWWSYAKSVLATAALVLVAEGHLQLDAAVRGKPFTLRHLLQHRAGLHCYGALPAYHAAAAAGEHPWPVEEMLRRVDADTFAYEPGHGWAYSNVGYFLVRNLIEGKAGMPLGPALERLVFGPLGISGVTVAREPADLDASAWGNTRRYHPNWVYHGLLIGTPSAAVLFLHRLLAGNLLPPDLLIAMQDGHAVGGAIPGRPWKTVNYGLGLAIGQGEPSGDYVGHTGGGPGSTSAVYQRTEGTTGAHVRCTAAAFAPVDNPGMVEARAMELAAHGLSSEVHDPHGGRVWKRHDPP
jgi:CubicO group peptidase (beta-lactamase class C family)